MKKNGLTDQAGHLPGFTDSAEDELQYCFALSNAMIGQQMQNELQLDQQAAARGENIGADAQRPLRQLRLRLLQEMLLEQVPSLRNQNAGAK